MTDLYTRFGDPVEWGGDGDGWGKLCARCVWLIDSQQDYSTFRARPYFPEYFALLFKLDFCPSNRGSDGT